MTPLILADKLRHALLWLPAWGWQQGIRRSPAGDPLHLLIAVADHFEPAILPWSPEQFAPRDEQEQRLERWCREYPRTMGKWRDAEGYPLCHTYFYPAEQHDPGLIARLAEHCHTGWGEIEIHLHHGVDAPDTPANTESTLAAFRDALEKEGCLSRWNGHGPARYAFVHGDWALANSAGGRYCRVPTTLLAARGLPRHRALPERPRRSCSRRLSRHCWRWSR